MGCGQPRVERGGSAPRTRAHHLSAARLADGAARACRGDAELDPRSPDTSAGSRAGHVRTRTKSKDSTPRPFTRGRQPSPPSHRRHRVELRHRRRASRLRALSGEEFDYSRPALREFKVAIRPQSPTTTASRRCAGSASIRSPIRSLSRTLDVVPAVSPDDVGHARADGDQNGQARVDLSAAAAPDAPHAKAALQDWRSWPISRCSTSSARWPTPRRSTFSEQIPHRAGLRRRRPGLGRRRRLSPLEHRHARPHRRRRGSEGRGNHPLLLRLADHAAERHRRHSPSSAAPPSAPAPA